MNEPTLTRREVTRLALAALGGLVTGALAGCGGDSTTKQKTPPEKAPADTAKGKGDGETTSRLLEDPHVCRGINTRLLECLRALLAGESVGAAIEQAAETAGPDLDRLAQNLRTWFHDWAAEGFFHAVEFRTVVSPVGSL